MVQSFTSTSPTKFRYGFTYFKHILKTLAYSSRISLRTLSDGLLAVQLLVEDKAVESDPIYVEYFIVPSIAEEEDL